jgi:TolA-binding protein
MSLYYLGQLLMDNDMEDDGAVYLFELINQFPDDETTDDASLTLSDYLERSGDKHRLALFLGNQLNRNGKYQDKFLLLKGELDEEQGNLEEAVLSYDRLIDEYPDSDYLSNAIHKKARIKINQGQEEDVISMLDMALRKALSESDKIDILVDKALLL